MRRDFNLPAGCSPDDIDGPAMPRCPQCGEEHNDWKSCGLCEDCMDDCQPEEEAETENFTPGCSIKVVCAWCKKMMGLKTCTQEMHGETSHSICPECAEKNFPK